MRLLNTGAFPTNLTEAKIIVNVESTLGQNIYDSNGKQSFLGGFNYSRSADNTSTDHTDSRIDNIINPIIELPRIPNGQFNFKLTDHDGTRLKLLSRISHRFL